MLSRIGLMLAVAIAAVSGHSALLSGTAAAQKPGPATGVTRTTYSGGQFINIEPGGWIEQRTTGATFDFVETARSANEIALYDASRNVRVNLDLRNKAVFYAVGQAEPVKLYDIAGIGLSGVFERCPPGTVLLPGGEDCGNPASEREASDKQPWNNPGCQSWRRRCDAGTTAACGNYEANCILK